jgi:hypothetical protein
MKSLVLFCLLALFLLARICSAHDKPTEPPFPSRAAFAAQMAKVEQGMTKEQVTALLGKPDVVNRYLVGSEMWSYGVTPTSGCATLGTVNFDKNKKVDETRGGYGTPPTESLISEAKLRELLDILWGIAPVHLGMDFGDSFDTLAYVKVVNTLQPYRKEQVLAVVNEYFRVCEFGEDNVLLMLRILFDPPNRRSFFPPHSSDNDVSFPPWPSDKAKVPRYPLVIIEDVPICIICGSPDGSIWSDGSYIRRFLNYLEKEGQIRKKPLRPPDNPLLVFDKFRASDQWLFGKKYPTPWASFRRQPNEEELGQEIVMRQLLRLVRSVLPASSPCRVYIKEDMPEIRSADLAQIRVELSKLSIHWNPKINDYQSN